MLVMTCMIPVSALLCEKYGKKRIMSLAGWGILLLSYPCYFLFTQEGSLLPLAGQVLFALLTGLFIGPVPIVLVDLFPVAVRYTGMSLAYNFSAAFFGGTTPIVATWLIQNTGDKTSPALYVMVCAAITLFTMRFFNAQMKKK